MKKISNVLLLLLSGGLFFMFACGSSAEVSEKSSNGEGSGSEKFSYTIDKQYKSGISYYIEGIVTNKTSSDYSYVQIEFICYDKEGNNLGTAMDNTNNLLGEQTWKYKAIFMGTADSVDHCDYHETTSW